MFNKKYDSKTVRRRWKPSFSCFYNSLTTGRQIVDLITITKKHLWHEC